MLNAMRALQSLFYGTGVVWLLHVYAARTLVTVYWCQTGASWRRLGRVTVCTKADAALCQWPASLAGSVRGPAVWAQCAQHATWSVVRAPRSRRTELRPSVLQTAAVAAQGRRRTLGSGCLVCP